MQLKVTSDISTEPVVIATAKNYVKYTGTDVTETALITSMIKAARELCEKYTGLTYAEKTIHCFIDPEDLDSQRKVTIPAVPIISIEDVYTIADDGTETELELNTGYYKYGMNEIEIYFPQVVLTGMDAITLAHYRVEFTAGFGDEDTEDLPEVLKIAILKQVAEWYENRENWIPVLSSEIKGILDAYVETTWLG